MMVCTFNLNTDDAIAEAIDFFASIGADDWFNDEAHFMSRDVRIHFVNFPEILLRVSKETNMSITRINHRGISFWVAYNEITNPILKGQLGVETQGANDGVIFCPMSNIKDIHTMGS